VSRTLTLSGFFLAVDLQLPDSKIPAKAIETAYRHLTRITVHTILNPYIAIVTALNINDVENVSDSARKSKAKRLFQRIATIQNQSPNREATIVKAERNRNIPNINSILALLLGGMLLCTEGAYAAKPVAQGNAAKTAKAVPAYATVGNVVITWAEFSRAFNSEARNKFFHGKPSDDVLAAFQREVGNKLVDNILLLKEAKRRKLKPDNAAVKQEMEKFERRLAQNPKWPEIRNRVLPLLTRNLQDENLRTQLEILVRNVPPPTTKQLKEYFDAHPDKFTSPPQNKVSVILIRVDPSSNDEEWRKATEEADGLVKRLRAGEDFAALAREYSGDVTAEDGGDMGYLHSGMLPGLPQQTVDKLQPGETSDPVRLLEGVAIFRLTDRIQPPPLSFESSQQRAKGLWLTEQSDIAWNSLKAKLRTQTPVHIDESRLLPLAATADKPATNDGNALPLKNE
jgi:parvulin-like peptidyl-prolyl isomerase